MTSLKENSTMTAPDPIVPATQLLLRSFDLQTRAERVLLAVREILLNPVLLTEEELAQLDEAVRLAHADISRAGLLEDSAMSLRRKLRLEEVFDVTGY